MPKKGRRGELPLEWRNGTNSLFMTIPTEVLLPAACCDLWTAGSYRPKFLCPEALWFKGPEDQKFVLLESERSDHS